MGGSSRNSGCGVYRKEDLNYKVREDLFTAHCSDIEEYQIMFIEIQSLTNENILVGLTYRHPKGSSINEYKNSLEKIFQKTQKKRKNKF